MKRMSILATLVVSGLLAVAALGAGSASADVLCERVNIGDCPAAETYGVGTEFHAAQHGAVYLKAQNGAVIFACGLSALDLKVTDAGGPIFNNYPKVDITKLTFGGCGENSATTVSGGSALIGRYNFSGSLKGRFNWSGAQISTVTNALGEGFKTPCTYAINGEGTLAGARTEEAFYETTKLIFNSTPAKRVGGSILCPTGAYLTVQYDFSELEWPKSIYVLKE